MQFARFEKPMFRVAFAALGDDDLRLLDFLRWLRIEGVHEQLSEHPLGPAEVWVGWSSETYLGFSAGRLMLQSGHRFGPSELVPPPSRLPWRRERYSVERQQRSFARYYPDYETPPVHGPLKVAHPGAYLRCAEASILCPVKPKRMLEIGAGNAVHVAFRHLLDPAMRTVVIDLPESACVGFILLRTMGIDVALPNEDREAAVSIRLPFQDIEGTFDFAFNMSSFQEMRIETVNRYLAVIRDRLADEGMLHLVNLRQSRQMPENMPERYDYAGFETPAITPALFHSSLAKRLDVVSARARASHAPAGSAGATRGANRLATTR